MQPIKAMLFAAGLGTRLKPFTEHHPKALAVVNDKTLLERNIAYLNSFGIHDIVHHFADQVIDFLRRYAHTDTHIAVSHEGMVLMKLAVGLRLLLPISGMLKLHLWS